MALRTVGAIGIDVSPDTSKFNNKLKDDLKRLEKSNALEIPVEPNADKMSEKVRAARNSVQERIDRGNIQIKIPVQPEDKTSIQEVRSSVNRLNNQIRSQDLKLKIPVAVDNDKIAQDLKEALREAQAELRDELKIKVTVEFDVQEAKEEWRQLKEELSGDSVELKADVDKGGKASAQIAYLSRNRVVDLAVRVTKRSLAVAEATLAGLTGENLLRGAARGLESFVSNLDGVLLTTARVGTMISSVASAGLAATSSLLGLGASIGQLGGYALILPTLAASAAAFAVAGVMAFKNFKDAVGGDMEALKKLPVQAAAAARSLQGSWTDMQIPVQRAFWSQMSGAFESLVKNVFPEVKTGLIAVGKEAGTMLQQTLFAFSQFGGTGLFSSMFNNLASGIKEASRGIGPLVSGILKLSVAAAGFLPDMGTWFADMAETFDQWVNRSQANGNITKWIENARTAAHNLGQSLIAIKGTLSALVDSARGGGSGNLETFAATMERVRGIVSSPVFQDTMTNLFAGAHQAIALTKDGLGDLGRALYSVAPTLRSIMGISGETIGATLSSIGTAIKSNVLNSGLVKFFEGIRDGMSGMLDYLPNVADGLGHLFEVLGALAKGIGPVIGELFGGVADTFSSLGPILKQLAPVFTNFSADAIGGLVTIMQTLAIPMRMLLEFFDKLPSGIQTALLALLLLRRFTAGSTGTTNLMTPLNNGLKEVPGNADRARSALSKPMGTGFMSASAFTPFMNELKAIPASVAQTFRLGMFTSAAADAQTAMRNLGATLAPAVTPGVQRAATLIERFGPQALERGRAAFIAATPGMASAMNNLAAKGIEGPAALALARVTESFKRLGPSAASGIALGNVAAQAAMRQMGTGLVTAQQGNIGLIRSAWAQAGPAIASGITASSGQSLAAMRTMATNLSAASTVGVTDVAARWKQLAPELARNIGTGAVSTQAAMKALGLGMQTATQSALTGTNSILARFGPQAAAHINTIAPLAQTGMQRFTAAMSEGAQTAMRGMSSAITAGGQAASRGLSALATAGTSAMRGLYNFIGGGWGVAFAAGFAVMARMQENARMVEQANRAVERSYLDIAKAATQAGQGLEGVAAQAAAIDRLNALADTKAGSTFLGFGKNTSVLDLLKDSGLGTQEFTDLMTGQGGEAGRAYIEGLKGQLATAQSIAGSGPGGFFANLIFGGELDSSQAALQGLLDSAKETQEAIDAIWKTDAGRGAAIPGVLANIAKAAKDGKVTLENIDGIRANVYNQLTGDGNKIEQFSTAFATTMGGNGAVVKQNFQDIQNALLQYQRTGASLAGEGPIDAIVKSMVKAGQPIANIKTALEGLGYSSEEAANKITFVWGPAMDKFGNALTVNGQQIPKMAEFSDGLNEFGTALAAASGIDPTLLIKAIRLDGVDPLKLGGDLGAAGVGMDQIRAAMEAMGQTGPGVSAALAAAAEAAGKLSAAGSLNPQVAAAFASALDQIRSSADGAAEKASALHEALDTLNGGKQTSFDIATTFYDAARAIGELNAASEDGASGIATLSTAFDRTTGNLNANVKGIGEVNQSLEDFATGGIAKAIQAYDDEMKASGDSVLARKAMSSSVQEMSPVLDGLRQSLANVNGGVDVSDEVWNNFLDTLGLTPDKIEILAIAQTEGAMGPLAELELKLEEVKPGVEITATALTDQAVTDLRGLGLIVESPDGKNFTIKTSADPEVAKQQLAAFQEYLKSAPIVAPATVTLPTPESMMAEMRARVAAMGPDAVSVNVGASVLGAEASIFGLRDTPVEITPAANIAHAILDILNLNGVQVTADAGANPTRGKGDITSGLNGTPVTADAGAIIQRAIGNIAVLNGFHVDVSAGATVGRALGNIYALNGTPVTATAGANTGPAASAIDRLNGRTVTVNVAANVGSALNSIFGLQNSANGNLFEAHKLGRAPRMKQFANGGIESHTAHIAKTLRIFAEPETGGEAYIPLSPAKRARSVAILSEVASRFGYSLMKASQKALNFENGGTTTGAVPGGAQIQINQYYPVTESDSVGVTRAAQLLAARGEI